MESEEIRVFVHAEEEFVPLYASEGAAGADVRAGVEEDLLIEPGGTALVPTGVRADIPFGYELQVRPRSGLALKNGVTVLNAPGTVDSDYRGEIGVILINHGKEIFRVTRGMRIAQLVLAPALKAFFVRKDLELSATVRGEKGFGHTGIE